MREWLLKRFHIDGQRGRHLSSPGTFIEEAEIVVRAVHDEPDGLTLAVTCIPI